ncbi:hypothetical protein JCM8097_003194 [Rhodosporidiobolus ruineniae]
MHVPDDQYCLFAAANSNSTFHGIKAFLSVKGQPAQVYGMDEKECEVAGVVQGEDGADFSLTVYDGRECASQDIGYVARLFFGTDYVTGYYDTPGSGRLRKDLAHNASERFDVLNSMRINDHQRRSFRFAHVATTEDTASVTHDESILGNLSIIRLKFCLIKEKKQHFIVPQDPEPRRDWHHDPLFKTLTATSSKSGSPPSSTSGSASKQWDYEYINPDKIDLTLTFKVLSEAAMQKYLVPAAPPPKPSTPVRALELGNTLYLDFDPDEAIAAHAASAVKPDPDAPAAPKRAALNTLGAPAPKRTTSQTQTQNPRDSGVAFADWSGGASSSFASAGESGNDASTVHDRSAGGSVDGVRVKQEAEPDEYDDLDIAVAPGFDWDAWEESARAAPRRVVKLEEE